MKYSNKHLFTNHWESSDRVHNKEDICILGVLGKIRYFFIFFGYCEKTEYLKYYTILNREQISIFWKFYNKKKNIRLLPPGNTYIQMGFK